jgi:hypothetical protein
MQARRERSGAGCSQLRHEATTWPPALTALEDWPTPSATRYGSSQNGINGKGGEFERPSAGTPSLDTIAAKLWPTPTVGDSKAAGSRNAENDKAHLGVSLTDMVRTGDSRGRRARPTLRAGASTSSTGPVPRLLSYVLNPYFVEALMGWPQGWTRIIATESIASGPREMELFPTRPHSPSPCSGNGSAGGVHDEA